MNKHIRSAATTAIALACLITTSAHADDLISAEDPPAILQIAKGFGSAELTTDDDGDPMIAGRISGTRYAVFFYRCQGGKACENIQFSAGWSGYQVSAAQLHDWNAQSLFGKAYLDEVGDPILELAVNLKHGVSKRNLDDTFDWWKVVLKGFENDVLNQSGAQTDGIEDVSTPI
jgi:hypothetical protein